MRGWRVRGSEPPRVGDEVRDDPFEQSGVGEHGRQVLGYVDQLVAGSQAQQGCADDLVDRDGP